MEKKNLSKILTLSKSKTLATVKQKKKWGGGRKRTLKRITNKSTFILKKKKDSVLYSKNKQISVLFAYKALL